MTGPNISSTRVAMTPEQKLEALKKSVRALRLSGRNPDREEKEFHRRAARELHTTPEGAKRFIDGLSSEQRKYVDLDREQASDAGKDAASVRLFKSLHWNARQDPTLTTFVRVAPLLYCPHEGSSAHDAL